MHWLTMTMFFPCSRSFPFPFLSLSCSPHSLPCSPMPVLLVGSLGNLGSAVLSATANHTNKIDPIMQAYLGMQYSGVFLCVDNFRCSLSYVVPSMT